MLAAASWVWRWRLDERRRGKLRWRRSLAADLWSCSEGSCYRLSLATAMSANTQIHQIQSFKYSFSNAEQQCQNHSWENMVPLSALWQLVLNLTQSMKRNPATRFLKQWRPMKIQLTPTPSSESCGKVKSTQYSNFNPCLNLTLSK